MQTIVIASRKGGSSKSMLTRHLAVEAERAGAGKVAMIDADPMRGLAQWWEARTAPTPILIDIASGLIAAIDGAERMGIDVLLIDTPPSAGEIVESAVGQADMLVIPVRPSPDDLRAVGSTVALARKTKTPLVFVISQTKPRARLTGQAIIALSQHGTVCPVMIADRTIYAASGTDGRTAPEIEPNGDAAKEITAAWHYLAGRLKDVSE